MAEIHNSSIPSSDVLTNETLHQLLTLANQHEYGLAYNASDNMRAVAGMQLAGEILSYMDSTITSKGAKKLGVQFGAYATALSLFGLLDLPKVSSEFTGVIDYASSLVFELVTEADTSSGFPATNDLSVRFLFHNGTVSNASEPTAYPLFGGSSDTVSWNDFQSSLSKFAVSNSEQWCIKCGNSTGTCAAYANNGGSASTQQKSSHNGISPAIGGVIGAMVTLAVVLGSLAAFMLLGGFRLVSKKHLAGAGAAAVQDEKVSTKA